MKFFFREYVSFVFLYLFNIIFLMVFYYFLGGFDNRNNLIYFIILSLFILGAFLVGKYLINRRLYNRLQKGYFEDFESSLSPLGISPLSESSHKLFKSQYRLYQKEIQEYNRKQDEYLTFINQWVHQMKTPLSVIKLTVQQNEYEPYMDTIRDEVEKLNKGLNMALYLARFNVFQHDFKVETIDLKPMIINVVNDLKHFFIKKRIYPSVDIKDDISIQSDKKWLMFILDQLVTNAIKYSIDEGKRVYISTYRREHKLVLEVKDEGVGIPKSDIRRVFDPFYTGENGRKFGESTGMGLYIVSEICKKLDHKLELESEVGQGTSVRILF